MERCEGEGEQERRLEMREKEGGGVRWGWE